MYNVAQHAVIAKEDGGKVDLKVGMKASRKVDRKVDSKADSKADRKTDRKIERQEDSEAGRQERRYWGGQRTIGRRWSAPPAVYSKDS